mgnify:CR=1 FL=1
MSKNIKLNETEYKGVSTVQLPATDGGTASFKDTDEIVTPSGTKTITENGTFDVTNFAQALVNVASGANGSSGSSGVLPIYTGEQVIGNSNIEKIIAHNLNLSSYIIIYWEKNVSEFIAGTEDAVIRTVFGIGGYQVDKNLCNEVYENTKNNKVLKINKAYKQSASSYHCQGAGYTDNSDENNFNIITAYGTRSTTYKWIIIDTTSLNGGE